MKNIKAPNLTPGTGKSDEATQLPSGFEDTPPTQNELFPRRRTTPKHEAMGHLRAIKQRLGL